eukprot:6193392-Pleurochrysis_carterae.AAC.2
MLFAWGPCSPGGVDLGGGWCAAKAKVVLLFDCNYDKRQTSLHKQLGGWRRRWAPDVPLRLYTIARHHCAK